MEWKIIIIYNHVRSSGNVEYYHYYKYCYSNESYNTVLKRMNVLEYKMITTAAVVA